MTSLTGLAGVSLGAKLCLSQKEALRRLVATKSASPVMGFHPAMSNQKLVSEMTQPKIHALLEEARIAVVGAHESWYADELPFGPPSETIDLERRFAAALAVLGAAHPDFVEEHFACFDRIRIFADSPETFAALRRLEERSNRVNVLPNLLLDEVGDVDKRFALSLSTLLGVVFLGHQTVLDPLACARQLVHEAGHQMLYILSAHAPLHHPECQTVVYSAARQTRRSVIGALHGLVAVERELILLESLEHRSLSANEEAVVVRDIAIIQEQLAESVEDLDRLELTELGSSIVDEVRHRLNRSRTV